VGLAEQVPGVARLREELGGAAGRGQRGQPVAAGSPQRDERAGRIAHLGFGAQGEAEEAVRERRVAPLAGAGGPHEGTGQAGPESCERAHRGGSR
jgi:hypothetical protein